ncbi:cardiotrophin-2-like [Anomaloglossus baeobatrachus]|uniref:cardiotrophin-2-like n=1 Tax=Anomaloglossus baeobatrachus TaxID=238106 RepID=UPI003F507441
MLTGAVFVVIGVAAWCRGAAALPLSGEEIITQINSLASLYKMNATVVLNTYLHHQGAPFSDDNFSFPSWFENGLPTAAMGFRAWRCLCPGDRLLLARQAFSIMSEFFQLIRDEQMSLNPSAAELHRLLETAQRSSEALLSNLNQAMLILGYQPPSSLAEPLSWASTDENTFKKKVRGYVLCREYKDWLMRVPKDMDILKATRNRRETAGQDRKDCCRP